jgi:3-hexulose-6-phosphate synthase
MGSGPEGRNKLQIALDFGNTPTLIALAHQVADYFDWMEAGTPWMMEDGMLAVRSLREAFPKKTIIADLKIMDAGKHEAGIAFAAGADIVTVLAVAGDATLRDAIAAAHERDRRVMVDLLQIRDQAERAREVLKMGAGYVCVHASYDDLMAGIGATSGLEAVGRVAGGALVVGGGIGVNNIAKVSGQHPAAIIVGRSVTEAADPRAVARELRQIVDRDSAR